MSHTSKEKSIFAPKRSERLINGIQKLRGHFKVVEYSDSSDEDMNEVTILETSKNGKTEGATNVSNNIPSKDNALTKSYLMWQNNANVCWLDASMALLVHNKTLIESVDKSSTTQIANIIQQYHKATSILNNSSSKIDIRVKTAKELLKTVQESALKYLQPIVKYKEGVPDSAFCSLFNLITEDKSVKELFDLEYTWVQMCNKCKTHRAKKHRKPIVTLPKVEGFQPSSPVSLYQCLVCKAPDQSMTLNFRTLPQCLLFHFESGAGKGELQSNVFEIDGRTYQLTGVMTLEKGKDFDLNHFVTFIRDPPTDMWLECNDLNDDIMSFSVVPPFIELQDVYILMFEASDEKGTVSNRSMAANKCGLGEEPVSESADIPLIDLADDAEKDGTERRNRGTSDKTLNYNEDSVNSKYPLKATMNLEVIEQFPSSSKSGNVILEESGDEGPGDNILYSNDNSLNYFALNTKINANNLRSNCKTGLEILHVLDCFCDNGGMDEELVNMVASDILCGMLGFDGIKRF